MAFFSAAPPFYLEILGVLNGNSLPILEYNATPTSGIPVQTTKCNELN